MRKKTKNKADSLKYKKRKKNPKSNKGLGSINKNTTFTELIQKHPESISVLLESGMHCFGCSMASYETLQQGASAHGIDTDELIKKINSSIKNKK